MLLLFCCSAVVLLWLLLRLLSSMLMETWLRNVFSFSIVVGCCYELSRNDDYDCDEKVKVFRNYSSG